MNRDNIVIVRGGGDIATGAIQKLYRAGFDVVVLECEKPTAIRRSVCVGEAIYENRITLEDLTAIKCNNIDDIYNVLMDKNIPVIVDENAEVIKTLKPICVIDGILAKRNLGTNKNMASITIALGPGFEASVDVDIVVETMRGHNLGRLIFNGYAMKNTGVPGEIKGVTKDRVIYSEYNGVINNLASIGYIVEKGQIIALVNNKPILATISGVLRGIIRHGFEVKKGLKIADIDPREDEVNNCFTISDKARTIGGAVLEALLYKINNINK